MASIHIKAAVNPQAARRYQRLERFRSAHAPRRQERGRTRRGWRVTLVLLGAGGARRVENKAGSSS
jgi:hypothetical protein